MATDNLPGPGAMFLDHTGHFVASADDATKALSDLGFTVTPFSAQVQPDPESGETKLTGTGNICVMLPSGYLEFLVYTADTPIGREFRDALNRRAGLHLSAFAVADAAEHHAKLEGSGHPMRPLVHFFREVETETGTEPARFTVARLAAGTMPEGRIQVLTHFNEKAMWQARWTAHDNGAQSLRAIVISTPDVHETASRFQRFFEIAPTPNGPSVTFQLDRGAVDVLPESDATALVGQTVETGRSVFVGLRIGVSDLSDMRQRVESVSTGSNDRLVVPFHQALGPGAWIFEQD